MNKMFEYYKLFSKNKLFSSAINLMLSAGITALFGFIFWTAVARSFHSDAVGLATTLLSMSGMISLLGLAGFDTVFVKFLPKSTRRNEQINSGLLIAGIASALLSLAFCMLLPIIAPKISFVTSNPWYVLAFVVFTVFNTWSVLATSVLVAYQKTSYVVVINILFSALKMIMPFLVHSGGPMMIFLFTGIATIFNVILAIVSLIHFCGYKPSFRIHFDILKETRRYGLASYISNILNLIPDFVLPLIVLNVLGPTSAAYFYIAFTVANLLYTIAFSTNAALLADASHTDRALSANVMRGLKITASILIPVSVILYILCPFILSIFGKGYQNGAVDILRILCFSGLAVMLYSTINFVFKHTKNLKGMLIMTTVNGAAIIALALLWTKPYGLIGVGWAWLIGTCVAVLVGGVIALRTREVT